MPSARIIRLGTRASLLARWQADWVASRLRELEIEVTLVPIVTHGDQQQSAVSIAALGNQGVFTKEIQHALLSDQIDLAVHSLKDLPTDPVPGLCLAAVPERAARGRRSCFQNILVSGNSAERCSCGNGESASPG